MVLLFMLMGSKYHFKFVIININILGTIHINMRPNISGVAPEVVNCCHGLRLTTFTRTEKIYMSMEPNG